MKEIGGYFELELSQREEYHKNAIKLNSARNAFKYILKSKNILKVYLPNFICNSMIEPLKELNISYEFYNINSDFELINTLELHNKEKLLYVNYFGLKSEYVKKLVACYDKKLIIDNTQAFFELPIDMIDTIYSPRKFFGVNNGGYLYTDKFLDKTLNSDNACDSFIQLIGRIETNASSFYPSYQQAENKLINLPIMLMAKLTQRILNSIDYNFVKAKRRENFFFLHNKLKNNNELDIDIQNISTPFIYPFMTKDITLRDKLIENKIYVAKYWDDVLDRKTTSALEKKLVNNIIALPIDQRYDISDMNIILNLINKLMSA